MTKVNQKKCIILANGKPPVKNVITNLFKSGYGTLICADGGANSAGKMGITPDYVIGDLDSIDEKYLRLFSKKSIIKKIKRQNDTDVEKCIKFAVKKGYNEAVLIGVTGDRLDHTFCNLGIMLKFYDQIKLKIIAENSFLAVYSGKAELEAEINETISLYGFDQMTKITSRGLKYPLKDTALPFGKRESTSNVAVSKKITLNIKGGLIFVVRDYKVMKKNGFI